MLRSENGRDIGFLLLERILTKNIAKETGTFLAENEVARHPLAYLMEAADDIAYSTADLEDAYKKELFTLEEFINFFEAEIEKEKEKKPECVPKAKILIEDLKEKMNEAGGTKEAHLIAFQNWMDFVRQWFMYCVAYSFSKNYQTIMSGTYNRELIDETFHGLSMKILKNAMARFVYENPEIVKLELAAQKILSSLLEDFIHAIIYFGEEDADYKQSQAEKKLCGLIPENLRDDYEHAKTGKTDVDLYLRFLMVTDFISGMTDSYAKNLYQELNGIN